jgi:hypothetical protein
LVVIARSRVVDLERLRPEKSLSKETRQSVFDAHLLVGWAREGLELYGADVAEDPFRGWKRGQEYSRPTKSISYSEILL